MSFKVAHEIQSPETEPKLVDLVRPAARPRAVRRPEGALHLDWRHPARLARPGHFRALTEQQEVWAIEQGFDEIVVKTKNKFYEMRGTLDHLRFEVVKYERNAADNAESKVYLSKKLHSEVLGTHRSAKTVVQVTYSRSRTRLSRGSCARGPTKMRPFIAMYTPAGSTCTKQSALPRLNSPSELPKAYGTIAPVSTIVFARAGRRAASAARSRPSCRCRA